MRRKLLPKLVFLLGAMIAQAGWCAYILLWMAFYWSAEAIPLAATALMPVFLFPFFGILDSQKVVGFYLNVSMVLLWRVYKNKHLNNVCRNVRDNYHCGTDKIPVIGAGHHVGG